MPPGELSVRAMDSGRGVLAKKFKNNRIKLSFSLIARDLCYVVSSRFSVMSLNAEEDYEIDLSTLNHL